MAKLDAGFLLLLGLFQVCLYKLDNIVLKGLTFKGYFYFYPKIIGSRYEIFEA